MTDATYRSLGQARCRTISKPLEIQINDTDSYLHDYLYRDLQALAKKSGSHRHNYCEPDSKSNYVVIMTLA